MAFDQGWLYPKIMGSEFIKDFMFDVRDRDTCREPALGTNVTVELFDLRKIVFKILWFVQDVSRVTHTVDRITW